MYHVLRMIGTLFGITIIIRLIKQDIIAFFETVVMDKRRGFR